MSVDETKHYVGDIGTIIQVDVGSDISTSTLRKFLVRKPSNEYVEWTASVGDPTQGVYKTLMYIVQAGDWDEAGTYALQAYVEMPGWQGRGVTAKFKIYNHYQ
jgi:hypothetical protein